MSKDQLIGVVIMLGSIIGLLVYLYLVWFSKYVMLVLQLTATVAVGGVLGILAWIGYTLATTPPPPSVEEIEKELEEELKKLEEEAKKEEGEGKEEKGEKTEAAEKAGSA